MEKLGSWKFEDFKGITLPQKAQSAFTEATSGITGASYIPLVYAGRQAVNGTNYAFIALQVLVLAEPKRRIVKLIVNEPLKGDSRIVSVVPIIKE